MVTTSPTFMMQLPKPFFRKQDKQEGISYSAVNGDADKSQAAINVPPSEWPAYAGFISRARVWLAIDFMLLILPISFIGEQASITKIVTNTVKR
jgi:hypothetical protein